MRLRSVPTTFLRRSRSGKAALIAVAVAAVLVLVGAAWVFANQGKAAKIDPTPVLSPEAEAKQQAQGEANLGRKETPPPPPTPVQPNSPYEPSPLVPRE